MKYRNKRTGEKHEHKKEMDAYSRLGMRHRNGSNIRHFDRIKLLLKEVWISVPFSDVKMGQMLYYKGEKSG